jgi:hypothetical protein
MMKSPVAANLLYLVSTPFASINHKSLGALAQAFAITVLDKQPAIWYNFLY